MKGNRAVLGLLVFCSTVATGWTGDKAPVDEVGPRLKNYCDPVCELRTQDAAFALLVETYRQFHGNQIESDYSSRLHRAEKLEPNTTGLVIKDDSEAMKKLREFVILLAAKERELRFAHLQVQVENLRTAYNCARRTDEKATGHVVPSQVDLKGAAQQLREFVILAPGTLAKAELQRPKTVPANAVLLNTEPFPLPTGQTVEGCTPEDPVVEVEPMEEDAKQCEQ